MLFPGSTPARLIAAADPFNLGDVPLYVMGDLDLTTVDPFTGATETTVTDGRGLPYTWVGSYNTYNGNVVQPDAIYGDLVMRNDGNLYAVTSYPTAGPPGIDQNVWSGMYVQLDEGDASNKPLSTQADGIVTYSIDPRTPRTWWRTATSTTPAACRSTPPHSTR